MGTISDRGEFSLQFTPYDKRHTLHFYPDSSADLCVEVRDLFGRVISSSARIVSENGPVTQELVYESSESPFGMQYFSNHNVVWIGSYGLRAGAPGTQTHQIEMTTFSTTVQLHLRPSEIDLIRREMRRLIDKLNSYREHIEGLGDLLDRLLERFNKWNNELVPRLQEIAQRVESENSAVNSALRKIENNSSTRIENLEELIRGSVELLNTIAQLKVDVERVRRALLDSRGDVQTMIDKLELDRVRLEGEIAAANHTVCQADQKIEDYNKHYKRQRRTQILLGIFTVGVGTAIAEGCGAGPSACDKLRKDKNWAKGAKTKAENEKEQVTKRKQKAIEARDRLQQMDRQLDQLIEKLTKQHSTLQRGVHTMQTYQDKLQKAAEKNSNTILRMVLAAWTRVAKTLRKLS